MLHLVLYQPQIPPNTGNIARLCVATQCELHLIHPLGFQADAAAVKRAGLDYWQHLSVHQHDSWAVFLQKYSQARMHFFSKKAKRPYTEVQYQDGDFLIFGSETKGLPDEILQEFQKDLCTIPMWGPTRSLNLSTSAGIVTYEALRQVTENFSKIKVNS